VSLLIVARGLQGIGGAAMFATTIALINVSYSGRDRGVAYGIWGAISGAGAGAGVIIGGILTDLLSWRWAFYVNLPISALAIVLSALVFSDTARHRVRIDVAGMITFTAGAGLLTYAIIRAGEDGWTAQAPLIAFVVGLIALAGFVVVQNRHENPLIDLKLLRNRAFTGATLAAMLFSMSAFGSFALISIWLQSVVGLNPLQTGLTLLPLAAVAFVVAAVFGRMMNDIPPFWPIAGGLLLIGAGTLLLTLVRAGSSWSALEPGLVVIGVGVGLVNPPLTSTALAAVPKERSGMASGIVNTARQLGLAFGVAILGTVFTSRAADVLEKAQVPQSHDIAQAVSGGQFAAVLGQAPAEFRDRLTTAVHQAFASGLHGAFVVAGGTGLVGAVLCYLLLRNARNAAWDRKPAAVAAEPEPAA
jgi:EmrB/QacA subfamily drug resistance transporter